MQPFKKLLRQLDYLTDKQIEQIHQAHLIAEEAHRGQTRYTGEPYITHPVAVSCILAEMHMDAETISAALLHDVLEDSSINKEILAERFGDNVAELVDGVTKLSLIEFKNRAEAQAEYFRKMILAMSKDIRVILVKLADRLHNMRTIEFLPPAKQRRVAKETLEIFAPIANRLGMHQISVELQELSFAARYPNRYRILKDSVRKARGNRREILSIIENTLQEGLKKSGIQHIDFSGREKHLYSLYKKMHDKHIPFNQIMDVYAFRIIVDSVDDCYRVLGVVHNIYKPVPERFKDYIAIPKANGYQSLHTTLFGPFGVPIEIQIRSTEMEHKANSGIAAHWLYKAGKQETSEAQLRAQQWVNSLLEMQQRTGSSIEFIENVKIDLFPDEVYVFTPGGDIMELPTGATAVDFAFAVHTDIGNTCVAAKIDRQLSPLSTVLSNGQTVEIITAKGARPGPNWLDFVVTGKARSSVRHFLKTQKRSESIALGRQLLNRALLGLSLKLEKIPKGALHRLLHEANLENVEDLLEQIGLGNRIAALEAQRIIAILNEKVEEVVVEKKSTQRPLQIKGTEGTVVEYATCCYPIPGDPVIGLLHPGKGIIIHAETCQQILKTQRDPEQYVPVHWADDVRGEFAALIAIDVFNQPGALAQITAVIADVGANIDDVRIQQRVETYYTMIFKLQVRDRDHLSQVMRNIQNLSSVLSVERIKIS